jgi:hypothetical protein
MLVVDIKLMSISDDPLYTDSLKFALYRSAAADTVARILEKTQEPWPRGMEVLEGIATKDKDDKYMSCPATVSDLWKAQVKRTAYAKRMQQAWTATKAKSATGREMDALLMPCTVWPACAKYVCR